MAENMKVKDITPSPHNVRSDLGDLTELVKSIKQSGIIEPLVARPTKKGHELIAGHRRLEAAKKAGLKEVPVHVRDATDGEVVALMLAENMQREEIDPVDEARGLFRAAEFGMGIRDLAATVGRSQKWVRERLLILDLPDAALPAIRDGSLPLKDVAACAAVAVDPRLGEVHETFWTERIEAAYRPLSAFLDVNAKLDRQESIDAGRAEARKLGVEDKLMLSEHGDPLTGKPKPSWKYVLSTEATYPWGDRPPYEMKGNLTLEEHDFDDKHIEWVLFRHTAWEDGGRKEYMVPLAVCKAPKNYGGTTDDPQKQAEKASREEARALKEERNGSLQAFVNTANKTQLTALLAHCVFVMAGQDTYKRTARDILNLEPVEVEDYGGKTRKDHATALKQELPTDVDLTKVPMDLLRRAAAVASVDVTFSGYGTLADPIRKTLAEAFPAESYPASPE